MQKVIKYNEGTLVIGYCENAQDISFYKNGTYLDPIRVTFIPNIVMSEQTCSKHLNENMKNIIADIKNIITENNIFYDNFEVSFDSDFTGYSIYRNHLNRDLLLVYKSTMNVNCKLKNNILQ